MKKFTFIIIISIGLLILCLGCSLIVLTRVFNDSFLAREITEVGLNKSEIENITDLKLPATAFDVKFSYSSWLDSYYYFKFEVDQVNLDSFIEINNLELNNKKDTNTFGNNYGDSLEWFNSKDTEDSIYFKPFRTDYYVEISIKAQPIEDGRYRLLAYGFST